jgi:PTH2 family peptidyl-tRNA hydrolase
MSYPEEEVEILRSSLKRHLTPEEIATILTGLEHRVYDIRHDFDCHPWGAEGEDLRLGAALEGVMPLIINKIEEARDLLVLVSRAAKKELQGNQRETSEEENFGRGEQSLRVENVVKQIIVIRRDLGVKFGKEGVRRGKEIAQGSHASGAFIGERVRRGRVEVDGCGCIMRKYGEHDGPASVLLEFSRAEWLWFQGKFTKIVTQVPDEKELLAVYEAAKAAGLVAYLITDAGLTEFAGVPTNTAVGIGPEFSDKIDLVTRHLKLY